ncbi:MAG TPA: SDR family oxidoreductase [Candidatus Margulisiibacteriota bacterium]|nr:SDR family oxidoreductase [Candidatus Margulisiibacteriota bacterium]
MSATRFERALVTGAAGGLGSALCRLFAADGTALVLLDWNAAGLEKVKAEIGSRVDVDNYVLDIRDCEALEACLKGILETHPRIDLVVGNAGIDHPIPLDHYDWREVNDHFATNVTANVVLCSVCVPYLLARGGGHIAAVASLGALGGFPYEAAYCSSKAALATFIEGLRAGLAPGRVTFTTVFPGFIDTPMLHGNAFAATGVMPADYAAARIHRAIVARQPTLHFPLSPYLQLCVAKLIPARLRDAIARSVMKKDFARRLA